MSVPQVRVQVAFDSEPAAATDVWTDITSWVDLAAGIRYGRGRQDERGQTSAHTCSLTLDNKDGRFTAASPTSPYSPNVRVGRKLRVTTRVGSGAGNLVSAENASFDGGTVGAWMDTFFGASASVTLANSITHWAHGGRALRVTWPTAAALSSGAVLEHSFVIGRTYILSAYVWVTAGTPAVVFGDVFGVMGSATSTMTGAWERLSFTWTATTGTAFLGVRANGATTAGQQVWVDSIMVDEGTTLPSFTTAAPPISDRYTGYVLGWPTGFPGGSVADVILTASDRIGYLDALRKMGPAPAEAILAEGPHGYWPLTDDAGTQSAAEVSGRSQPGLVATDYRGTGVIEFGAGTGPATDSASAVVFTPTSSTNGRFLSTSLNRGIGFFGATLLCCFNTSAGSVAQTLVRLTDGFGWILDLGTNSSGRLTATQSDPFGGTKFTLTSSSSVADGATRVGAIKVDIVGSTTTVTLWVDGAQVASTSYTDSWMPTAAAAHVGGSPSGALYTGTMSHVAAWSTGDVDVAAISSAILDGLAGQTVNDSLSQVALWAGIAAADLVAETGSLTETDHRPTEGQAPAQVLLALATDEGGALYVDGSGRYQFQARDHRWNMAPVLEIDSQHLATSDIQVDYDTQGVANDAQASRPRGGSSRVVNSDSVAALGALEHQVSVAAAQDSDLLARAGWEANSRATPYPRISSLPVDLLTMDDALTLEMVDLDVGDTFTLVTMPSQAAAQAFDLTVEGWSETLSLTEWRMDVNTSRSVGTPSSGMAVSGQRLLTIDDVTSGLDMGFITGY